MALTRDQRRAMERSLERMAHRRQANAVRATAPIHDGKVVPITATPEGFAPEGTISEASATPSRKAVEHVAGRMWWAAQSPAIADDQRDRLLAARDTVLRESALA